MIVRLTLALLTTAVSFQARADGDTAKGRDLARSQCARCHGVDGNARSTSFQPVPMLAGQPAVYLVQEMQNYVSGTRTDSSKNSNMVGFLIDLTDQDMQDIAAYYQAQEHY